jgi:hypothetical protein
MALGVIDLVLLAALVAARREREFVGCLNASCTLWQQPADHHHEAALVDVVSIALWEAICRRRYKVGRLKEVL